MTDQRSNISWKTRQREPSSITLNMNGAILRAPFCGYDGSGRERRCQVLKLTLLAIIPGFILIVRNTISLVDNANILQDNNYVQENILFSTEIGDVIHSLQIERGTTALYVSSKGDPYIWSRLNTLYSSTDRAIFKLSKWSPKNDPAYFQTRSAFHNELKRYRFELDPLNATLNDVISFYTDINAILIQRIGASLNLQSALNYWTDLVAYQMLLISKEQAGIERALGSTFYARGQFPIEDLIWYKEKKILGSTYLAQSVVYSELARDLLGSLYIDTMLNRNLDIMRETISENQASGPSVVSGAIWFDNMTDYINIIKTIQDRLGLQIVQTTNKQNQNLEEKLIVSVFELATAVIMAPVIVILIRNIIIKIQMFSVELKNKTLDLEQERKRTEGLLYQLLPKTVAGKLMDQGHAIPEAYQSATIMFSDVVGFTQISSQSTPMQVVNMLNKLYMTTDSRLEFFDVYKVETIGDGYMVASGLPNRNGDNHVIEIAKLSLDLLANAEDMTIPHMDNEYLRLRIGFNTGPCVAGVVGIKMPRYCVFGDTVNTASRMESHSLPERIQMSESSSMLLKKQDAGFIMSERGTLEIKGKGTMRTYWLEGYSDRTDRPSSQHKERIELDMVTASSALDYSIKEHNSHLVYSPDSARNINLSKDAVTFTLTGMRNGNGRKDSTNARLILVHEKEDTFANQFSDNNGYI